MAARPWDISFLLCKWGLAQPPSFRIEQAGCRGAQRKGSLLEAGREAVFKLALKGRKAHMPAVGLEHSPVCEEGKVSDAARGGRAWPGWAS